jgi:hypothetical protein
MSEMIPTTEQMRETIAQMAASLDKLRPADRKFAESMLDQYNKRGGLSEKQWPWVEKFAGVKQAAKDFKRLAAKHTRNVGGMSGLIDMLRHAKQHLKFPKLFLETDPYAVELTCSHCGYNMPLMQRRNGEGVADLMDRIPKTVPCPSGDGGTLVPRPIGHPVRLALAGPKSRYEGEIMVTDGGPWGNNVWYGRIGDDGGWFCPPNAQNLHEIGNVETLLMAMATHPVETAASHGKLRGNCCFCGNELSDPTSTDLGYGKTCARNFGLSWGKRALSDTIKTGTTG